MNNKKQEIIQQLKDTYNRDLRKQIVKTILANETVNHSPDYKIINQIFSYVLKELNWKLVDNTENWDNTPLEIMKDSFPKITNTTWFQEQKLTARKIIEMKMQD